MAVVWAGLCGCVCKVVRIPGSMAGGVSLCVKGQGSGWGCVPGLALCGWEAGVAGRGNFLGPWP